MTTEVAQIKRHVDAMAWPRWIAAATAGWLGLIVAITLVVEPVRTVIVFGPEARIMSAIARTDVRIVDARAGMAIVTSAQPGFVRELYASGAWLVLPRRLGGCMSRRS